MSSPPDAPTPEQHALSQRGDAWLELVLGPTLQAATIRSVLYLLGAGVVLATLARVLG